MIKKIPEILDGKITFVIGNSKGAGKTTFLNFASRCVRPLSSPVLATVGVDGEKYDTVFSTPKPCILTEAGDYIITTDKMLKSSEGHYQILEVFPFRTVLGRLLLAKTIRKGHIELVGPENNEQLSDILNYVKQEKGLNTILIDGSINRLTQVSTLSDSSFIYVAKITKDNLNSSIEKMRSIHLLNSIKKNDKKIHENNIYFNGALTKNKMINLDLGNSDLILEDFTRIFLDYSEIKKIMDKNTIYFKTVFNLQCFIVTLIDVNVSDFEKKLDDSIRKVVVYNPYGV